MFLYLNHIQIMDFCIYIPYLFYIYHFTILVKIFLNYINILLYPYYLLFINITFLIIIIQFYISINLTNINSLLINHHLFNFHFI